MAKTILITGSTDGIGKLAAIELAKEGHKVLLHGRNPSKLNSVITEIHELSGNELVGGYVADLSSLEAVESLAKSVAEENDHLDVLINNAGVYKSSNSQTSYGIDIRFVVNYLAPYLLTQHLLLLMSTHSRIINLSSAAQQPVSLSALQGREHLGEMEAYAQSKLALTMWSFWLARNQDRSSVIAVNPGSLLDTRMVREGFGRTMSSADKGGDVLKALAVDPEFEGETGKYFDNDKGRVRGSFGDAHPDAYNQAKVQQLITATDRILSEAVE